MSSYTVETAELNEEFTIAVPRYPLLPATLLGRLAVDNRYQGQGFGKLMLIDALNQSLKTTSVVGSLAVVVEALNRDVFKFYQLLSTLWFSAIQATSYETLFNHKIDR